MVDEEEDRQKENKDAEQKEGSSGTSGGVEEEGSAEVKDDSKQAPETPGPRAAQAGPARVSRGTDEENGEELEQLPAEPPEAAGGEAEARAAGSEQDEADLDPQRPPRPEVKITSPQENENNEPNKDYAAVA